MLFQCPNFDTTCLNPGAGVICPLAVTTNVLDVTETSVSQDVQSSASANETKQAPLLITATLLVVTLFLHN